ncbi:MAG: UPF0147 family protein [Candidatus Diapherotrites archaeon]|nr:UPF0147 family protein [Candidatus Diapherotrites archaeon]
MAKKIPVDSKIEMKTAISFMEEVLGDRGVPKNIRAAVERARQKLNAEVDLDSNLSSAIYELDDVSSDINMPEHTRTTLWEIVSELERVKELIKK